MKFTKARILLLVVCVLWLSATGVGVGLLWDYENTPGTASAAPAQWPEASRLRRSADGATLVLLAHPHCPCTRASLGELSRLMAQAEGRVTAYVLFVKPRGFAVEWEKTDLWSSAEAIPGVRVVRDDEGVEAGRFRAATSGQVTLYDREGRLLFSGGITSARGHEGDNAGRAAIVSLLHTDEAGLDETPVFGCPLFAQSDECQTGKEVGHARDEH
ncbi:MAG TPA: hypothetical protein VFS10_05660 [Pyrinomonadaceae bacterium]|nr:hypothetical protein [Pyrinomonadaceae bacterium]